MNTLQFNCNTFKENFIDVQNNSDTTLLESHLKTTQSPSIRALIFLLKKLSIYELFEKHAKDGRNKKCIYSIGSLLMVALQILLFRSFSKNDFYQKRIAGKSYKNLGKFAHIEEDRFPHSKTIDDALLSLDPSSLEPILFDIFKKLRTSKLFKNHPSLKKNGKFRLSIDAVCTHVYHSNSQHPCEACAFCLKRKSKNGKIWYQHVEVVASLIFEDVLQLPLLCYPIKKRREWQTLSDDALKQECEQTALPIVLEKIRSYLPKLKMTVLLDGLHANQTSIQLLKEFHFEFDIVLKRLKSVQEEIDTIDSHIRHIEKERFNLAQTASFTNDIPYAGSTLNVIEFREHAEKKPSKRFAKIMSRDVHYQWIVSERLDASILFGKVEESRSRWKEEDFFNSVKTRGFNLKHDFSRHPMCQLIWHILTLIAFSLSSIFFLSDVGIKARKTATMRSIMQQMLQELFYLTYEAIFLGSDSKQLRFSLWMNAG